MASHDRFSELFHTCLAELPDEDRLTIHQYWHAWQAIPEVIADEKDFPAGAVVETAQVRGIGCLHIFLFRSYIVESAPESVQRTIIKHELAHCVVFGQNTRWKAPPQISRTLFESRLDAAFRTTGAALDMLQLRDLYESSASAKNQEWGSDEPAAHDWCEAYLLRNSKK